MLLRELRYFATVAERGSVVGAAKELRVAQPSLSRQVRRLEDTVGTPLFFRERRGVRLTPAGQALLRRTREVFGHLDETFRRVHLANEGKLGTLRVGLGRVALDNSRVGRALVAFRQQFPDIALVVSEVSSGRQSARLQARELDVAIGMDVESDEGVEKHAMFAFQVDAAILAVGDPLAKQATIDIAQLRDKRLLVVERSVTGDVPRLFEALRRAGVTTWDEHESVESVYTLVAAGRGWTLAPSLLVTKPPVGTVVIPLSGFSVPMSMTIRAPRGERSAIVDNMTALLTDSSDERRPLKSLARAGTRPSPQGVPRGLELRHLKTLTVVAQHGSLSRAAEQLGLTQSAVSRQIRALERELGLVLLQRDAQGVAPTAAGDVLRLEAHAILALVDEAVAHVRQTVRGVTGTCHIGAVALEFAGDIIVRALKRLEETVPDIAVQVNEMLSLEQVRALRERRIDIGIAGANVGIMDDPSITGVRLVEDVIECALLPVTHELATRAWLKPSDLADVPFVFIARETQPRLFDNVMSALKSIGLEPKMKGSFNGPRTLWQSVADGLGWTIGSRSNRTNPLPGLVAIPIEGLSIPSGLQLIWRRDEADPATLTVIDAFREARAEHE